MSYLLRVALPDRPGSLGHLALALGRASADITSFELVERTGDTAVDDIVVELPTGALSDVLISAAEGVPGVHVLSLQPFAGAFGPKEDLRLLDDVAAAPPRDRTQVLVDRLPHALRADWALAIEVTATGEGHRRVHSAAAPETHAGPRVPWLPLAEPQSFEDDAEWLPAEWARAGITTAAAPVTGTSLVILVGRAGGPRFRESEIARLGYTTGVIGKLLGGGS